MAVGLACPRRGPSTGGARAARRCRPIGARATLVASVLLAGAPACSPRGEVQHLQPAADPCGDPEAARAAVELPSAEGGEPTVTAHWVVANRCAIRLVDVRERHELTSEQGHIAGVESVPILTLPAAAASWDRDDPIVLVCRRGRRSRGGAELLRSMGFSRVAVLDGGMAAWSGAGFEVSRAHGDVVHVTVPEAETPGVEVRQAPAWAGSGALSLRHVREHFEGEDLRWVQVAELMLRGHESCVDGREDRPMVGTPGGDAGELVLLLAAVERVTGRPLEAGHVPALLADYLDTFQQFYMHTDTHALERLLGALHRDPRFADHVPEEGDIQHAEIFVRHPPEHLRSALMEHVLEPRHVGCGHLRLVLEHPEEYGVRRELVRGVMRATFEALWERHPGIDYEVLRGSHEEGAVVNVTVEGPVRSFTWVPEVRPRVRGAQIFVNHPQVGAYLRREATLFLIDREAWMHLSPNRAGELVDTLDELAVAQLDATVRHLAPTLPVFDVHFDARRTSATRLR